MKIEIIAKLAAVFIFLSLSCAGIAGAVPAPDVEDLPEVDETAALDYAADHDGEICRMLDDRLAQRKPSMYLFLSVVAEVSKSSGFNSETAGYVLGAAIAGSCPEHLTDFDAVLGEETV